jgi:hypothetical protein
LAGDDGTKLHDGVGRLSLDTTGSHHHTVLVEQQVGRIEEDDLTDLSIERIHAQPGHRRPPVPIGHAELQLDAVGALEELQDRRDLLGGQRRSLLVHGSIRLVRHVISLLAGHCRRRPVRRALVPRARWRAGGWAGTTPARVDRQVAMTAGPFRAAGPACSAHHTVDERQTSRVVGGLLYRGRLGAAYCDRISGSSAPEEGR